MVENIGIEPDLCEGLSINVKDSAYFRLMKARKELSQMNLKKSGVNTVFHYKYYELDDFLPQAQQVMFNNGLCPIFNINSEEATLALCDVLTENSKIVFRTPIPTISTIANQKVSGCQAMGMLHAYFKRYLYMNALEICESDGYVDGPGGWKESKEIEEELKKIHEHIYNNPGIKQELTKIETVDDANKLVKTGSITQLDKRILDRIMRVRFGNKVYFNPMEQQYVQSASQRVKEMVEQLGKKVVQKEAVTG
jgi:hypothetical protein